MGLTQAQLATHKRTHCGRGHNLSEVGTFQKRGGLGHYSQACCQCKVENNAKSAARRKEKLHEEGATRREEAGKYVLLSDRGGSEGVVRIDLSTWVKPGLRTPKEWEGAACIGKWKEADAARETPGGNSVKAKRVMAAICKPCPFYETCEYRVEMPK